MSINFKKLVKPYINTLYTTLTHFVEIPSVNDPLTKSEDKPYGEAIDKALKEFAKLGDMYGFKVELDSHYVELSLGEAGPLIEVFGHLDVVPSTSKDKDMFKVTNDKEKLYGRGVADDKGPLLASLYAIKALKDNNLISNCRIKIFAGGDEECGSSCLEYYVKNRKKEAPTYGFTPDSKFPLVYGEKGTSNIKLKKKIEFKHIVSIKGGEAPNIVISHATFKVDNINEIKDKLTVQHIIDNDEITFIGMAAHGSTPELGKNAFLLGLKELAMINEDKEAFEFADALLDTTGKKFNAYSKCEHLLETSFNVGLVDYENNVLEYVVNMRYPEKPEPQALAKNLAKSLNSEIISESYSGILLHDLNSPLITALLAAYRSETNDTRMPSISGGGTYAKEVANTVAFGAEFPDADYKMHQEGEFIYKDQLITSMAIYAHAIYNLMKHEN